MPGISFSHKNSQPPDLEHSSSRQRKNQSAVERLPSTFSAALRRRFVWSLRGASRSCSNCLSPLVNAQSPPAPHSRPVWPLSRRSCRLRWRAWLGWTAPNYGSTASTGPLSPFQVFGVPSVHAHSVRTPLRNWRLGSNLDPIESELSRGASLQTDILAGDSLQQEYVNCYGLQMFWSGQAVSNVVRH